MRRSRLVRAWGVWGAAIAVVLLTSCGSTVAPGAGQHHVSTAPRAGHPEGAAAPRAITRRSWNPNVKCRAVVTHLIHVLGTKRSALGGARFVGGGFRPGIPNRRAFHPPCRAKGRSTFVQLDHVKVGSCSKINKDGDWTCVLTAPAAPRSRPRDFKNIHIETDQKFWRRPGWRFPPGGKFIDVQGFVFWDPDHTRAAWHFHTGWELHSFTAWRRSR
ncbi:MAG: hypothetical protein ACRDP1_16795 [Nocardioidaceae bacterium]